MKKSIRSGLALAGLAGVVSLAGCGAVTVGGSSSDTSDAETSDTTTGASSAPSTSSDTSESTGDSGAYADGTYTESGTYVDGGGVTEEISVTITLDDSVVTAVEVQGDSGASAQSTQYQEEFIAGIAEEVVGKNIDEISVTKVGRSSLTGAGFNAALALIKEDAAA